MKMDKKNYPHVYLEECRYKIKKKKTRFIDVELDLIDSDDLMVLILNNYIYLLTGGHL